MKIIYPFFLSLLLNSILIFAIVVMINVTPRSNFSKYEPLKVKLTMEAPVQEDRIIGQLGNLVKKISVSKVKPIIISNFPQKKQLRFTAPKIIEKKTLVLNEKIPALVTKDKIHLSYSTPKVSLRKKDLGERIMVNPVSKHYFQVKNVGWTNLLSRENVYTKNTLNVQPIIKKELNYDFNSNSVVKKTINFDDLSNIKGGDIVFSNVDKVKEVLHQRYMKMVQNAVNNNLTSPVGKITIEVAFYPDGLIKILKVEGTATSPQLQDLLKSSIQNLSFVTTKNVQLTITYNFNSKLGGLK